MQPYTVEFYGDRESWLPKRGLGGSDAACILGLDKYKPPIQLWAELTEKITRQDGPSLPRRAGQRLEPLVLELIEEDQEQPVWKPGHRKSLICQMRNKERPWQTYTADGLLLAGERRAWSQVSGIVEAKHTEIEDSWAERDSEGPLRAEAQIHHGHSVMGEGDYSFMGALLSNRTFVSYRVPYDQDIVDYLIEMEEEFRRLVETDTPPPPNFAASTSNVLERLLSHAIAEKVQFPEGHEVTQAVRDLQITSTERLRLEKQEKTLRHGIQHHALFAAGISADAEPWDDDKELRIETPGGNYKWSSAERKGYTVEPTRVTTMRKVK